jgi:hypothetical protein
MLESACPASKTRFFTVVGVVLVVPVLLMTISAGRGDLHDNRNATDAEKFPDGKAFHFYVDQGSPEGAKKYYGAVVTPQTGFVTGYNPKGELTGNLPPLDALLKDWGYQELRALDIQKLPSDVLMDVSQLRTRVSNGVDFDKFFGNPPAANDEIRTTLVARFFAPKITDVSGRVQPVSYGWRKVVRLRPRAGSVAADKKFRSLFLLFNFFKSVSEVAQDPFENNSSDNNQVILVREKMSPLPSPAYFLVFENLNKGGTLKLFLAATFDAQDPNLPQPAPYYVPNACIACHAHKGLAARPRLSYLDTDHWRDRVEPTDDFADLYKKSKHGVLFDGGRDETTESFKQAFTVFRKLNTEIRAQNADIYDKPDEDNYQLRAADAWLEHHPIGKEGYLPPIERALVPVDGEPWKKGVAVDEALLPLLNRYCFRCHSSVKYHVFDRAMVQERIAGAAGILERIKSSTSVNQRMPQDRNLDEGTIKTLTDLLQQVGSETLQFNSR